MPLAFPTATRSWDATLKVVVFAAEDSGRPVRCIIAADALRDHFGMAGNTELDATRAFDRCRMVIEEAASRKYDRWRLNGGEVSLRSRDFGR